jgi:citrate/tricarballylate utilization protein
MYAPPHEFDLDLPKALSAVRLNDYRRYVWPTHPPRLFTGWWGVVAGATIATAILLAVAVAHTGWSGLVATTDGASGPYRVIPHTPMLILAFAASGFAVLVMAAAAHRYWREVPRPPGSLPRAIYAAALESLTLRFMRGGGQECYFPVDDQPTPLRRRLHAVIVSGFALCLLSTVAAAVSQEILGTQPPYAWLSVPVIAGAAGGIGLVIGGVGLLRLKVRSSPVTSFREMTIKDYGLLVALVFLGASGFAVLALRTTSVFGVVLVIHLAAVLECMAMAPYSKFVHAVFRATALVRDNLERQQAAAKIKA